MMSHTSNQHPHGEQLSAYIDSMLDVPRMRTVGEHLHACATCRSLEADLRRTKLLVRGLPEPRLPASDFWTSAYRQLRVDDRTRAAVKPPFWSALRAPEQRAHRRWAAGLASAALVGLLIAGPLMPATHVVDPTPVRVVVPAQDVSPDVSSLAELHADSVSRLPLADPDRQKMIAAEVQQPASEAAASAAAASTASASTAFDTAEAAGYADASF